MSARYPRLKQPLCVRNNVPDRQLARLAIIAYDTVYNQLYHPQDMHPADVEQNAQAVLNNLYDFITAQVGPAHEYFETSNIITLENI